MRKLSDARLHLAFSLLLGLTLGGCDDDQYLVEVVAPVVEAPDLRLIVLTDLKGYLAPCGCTSRPLGGIDRTATRIAELRSDGVPSLVVAAGSTLFGESIEGPEGARTQELWQAQTLRQVLDEVDLAATTPGYRDFAHGPEAFANAARGSEFAWLAAGMAGPGTVGSDAENPLEDPTVQLQSSKMLLIGGRRIGLVGITESDPGRSSAPAGFTQSNDVVGQAQSVVERLREEGAEVVIGLGNGQRTFIQRAAAMAAPDFLVHGGLDQDEAIPPRSSSRSWLLHAGRQGQGLLIVELYLDGDGAWSDESPWSRANEAAAMETEATSLRDRIAAWEAAGDVNPADVATQRERLTRMEGELESLRRPPEGARGRRFVARWEEISPDVTPSPAISRTIGEYDRRVNDHNREAFADWSPPPPAPGQAHYVGSAACESCHEEAYVWWQRHPHGRAYATLQGRHKEYDLSCVGCHVTGYGRPGGATVTHNLEGALVNVGCEVCHGPGSAHAAAPDVPDPNFRAEAPERVCLGCHNEEHSDLFDYSAYRGRLLVPGHGLGSP